MLKSPKAQHFIASSITALLAANAFVLVTGIIGGDKNDAPAVSTDAKTITYIQNADGTQTVVDPTTPEGSQAINDAQQRGEQVVTVPTEQAPAAVQAQKVTTTTTRPGTKPVASHGAGSGVTIPGVTIPGVTIPGVTIPDVNGVVNTVVSTVNSVVGTVNETLTTATSIVEDTTGVTVPHVTVPTVPTTTTTTTAPADDEDDPPPTTTPAVTVPPPLPGGGSTVVPSLTVEVPGLP